MVDASRSGLLRNTGLESAMTADAKRVGLLIPSPGVVTRDEFRRLLGGAIPIFREVEPPSLPESTDWQLPRTALEQAVRDLVAQNVDVIVHTGVVPSVSLGMEREREISDAIKSVTGVPHIVAMDASLAGLRSLRVRNIAIVSPLNEEMGDRIRSYFSAHGLSVQNVVGLGGASAHEVHSIDESDVLAAARQVVESQSPVDCVYIFGGGLRSLNTLSSIERFTQRPAVSSNVASAWATRRLIGMSSTVPGCGSLLA
jgi:maleate cis-trans isomerase